MPPAARLVMFSDGKYGTQVRGLNLAFPTRWRDVGFAYKDKDRAQRAFEDLCASHKEPDVTVIEERTL